MDWFRAAKGQGDSMEVAQMARFLVAAMTTQSRTHQPFYGDLSGAWIGGLKSPEQRFRLITANFLNNAVGQLKSGWVIDVETDEGGKPTELILGKDREVLVIPLRFGSRRMQVGDVPVLLSGSSAGMTVMMTLASQSAAFFKAPSRSDEMFEGDQADELIFGP